MFSRWIVTNITSASVTTFLAFLAGIVSWSVYCTRFLLKLVWTVSLKANTSLYTSNFLPRIMSGYGLGDPAIEIQSPAEARDFSCNLCVQTGSGALLPPPASCTMGTGGKARPGRDADHSTHLVTRSWMSRSYTSSPPPRLHKCVVGLILLFPRLNRTKICRLIANSISPNIFFLSCNVKIINMQSCYWKQY
jgi:hypothetical protein